MNHKHELPQAFPPALATLTLVLRLAAASPLCLCGASPPSRLTLSLVLLLADAKPLLEPALLLRLAELPPRLAELPPRLDEDLDAAFFGAVFLEAAFLGAAFFDALLLDELFEAVLELPLLDERDGEDFDDADLEAELLEEPPRELLEPDDEDLLLPPADDLLLFFLGTFSPSSLASDKPMAIACLREVTFLPLRPLFNCPCFFSCIAFSTFLPAPFEYLAIIFDLKGLLSDA